MENDLKKLRDTILNYKRYLKNNNSYEAFLTLDGLHSNYFAITGEELFDRDKYLNDNKEILHRNNKLLLLYKNNIQSFNEDNEILLPNIMNELESLTDNNYYKSSTLKKDDMFLLIKEFLSYKNINSELLDKLLIDNKIVFCNKRRFKSNHTNNLIDKDNSYIFIGNFKENYKTASIIIHELFHMLDVYDMNNNDKLLYLTTSPFCEYYSQKGEIDFADFLLKENISCYDGKGLRGDYYGSLFLNLFMSTLGSDNNSIEYGYSGLLALMSDKEKNINNLKSKVYDESLFKKAGVDLTSVKKTLRYKKSC